MAAVSGVVGVLVAGVADLDRIKFKINEIFCSIQGEGILVGIPMNFIRFTRCNRKCEWCDTDFSDGIDMTIGEIEKKLDKKIKWVSLTGGEPMLERDLLILIKKFKEKNFKILLETNGTLFERKIFEACDFISLDIKAPSSGNCRYNKDALQYCLRNSKKSQLKIVIQDDNDIKFFKNIFKKNKRYPNWIIQPEWSAREKLQYSKIIKFFDNNIRIIPQVHRILGVR